MKNFKRITSWLLVLTMLFSFCTPAFADDGEGGEGSTPAYPYLQLDNVQVDTANKTASVDVKMAGLTTGKVASGVQFLVKSDSANVTISSITQGVKASLFQAENGLVLSTKTDADLKEEDPAGFQNGDVLCTINLALGDSWTADDGLKLSFSGVTISQSAYATDIANDRDPGTTNTDETTHLNVSTPADPSTETAEVVDEYAVVDTNGEKLSAPDGGNKTANETNVYPQTPTYGLVVTTDKESYNVGDTVTATVTLTTNIDADVSGYKFQLGYDQDYLEIVAGSVASLTSLAVTSNTGDDGDIASKIGTMTAVGSGDVDLFADGVRSVQLLTIEFTALKGTGDAETSIVAKEDNDIWTGGDQNTTTATTTAAEFPIHGNVKVTLVPGAGGKLGDKDVGTSVELYAKYGLPGLYSDEDCTADNKVTSLTVAAADNYRLKDKSDEKLWVDANNGSKTYADFDAIAAATFTANTTINLQTVNVVDVTITVTNGSFTKKADSTTSTSITIEDVDGGTALTTLVGENGLYTVAPTDDSNYNDPAWVTVGSDSSTETITYGDYTIPTDGTTAALTLNVNYAAKTHNFTASVDTGASISELAGVTGWDSSAMTGTVTYNQDVTFTVTSQGGYYVTGVTYTVGSGESATTNEATSNNNGSYTIPGTAITSDVKLNVAAIPFVKVTFKSGDNAKINGGTTDVVLYAAPNSNDLYTSEKNLAEAKAENKQSVPTVTANEGYRVPIDSETLWISDDGTTKIAANAIDSTTYSSDITLTAQVIKQYVVTYKTVEGDTSKGYFVVNDAENQGTTTKVAETTITFDENATLTTPTVEAVAGYVFDKWEPTVADDTKVTETATYTVSFKDGTYDINAGDTTKYNVDDKTNIDTIATATPGGEDKYTVTHGKDVSFTVKPAGDNAITGVSITIGGEAVTPSADGVTVTTNGDGTYSVIIPGNMITGSVGITVETKEWYTIKYQIASTDKDYGSFANDVTDPYTKGYDKDATLGSTVPTATANAGYVFQGWTKGDSTDYVTDMAAETVTANATYTAHFAAGQYTVTFPLDSNNESVTVTYDPDKTDEGVDFTPDSNGKVVIGVTYTVENVKDGDGNPKEFTPIKNNDGSYTIPASNVTGNVTVSYDTIDGKIYFISNDVYNAAPTGTDGYDMKIAVIVAAEDAAGDGKTLSVTGDHPIYYSSKYQGFVVFVDHDATAASVAAMLNKAEGSAVKISYDGDIDDNGSVNVADAGNILMLQNKMTLNFTTTDLMRFESDVNGDGKVISSDSQWVQNDYVGKKQTETATWYQTTVQAASQQA
jgi:uncharacterized repeat protein (TIGR02543 family)